MCPENKWRRNTSEEVIANLAGEKHAVKLEEIEEEDVPLPKRQKTSSSLTTDNNKWDLDPNKPGPLGLRLDITPEFLKLIQMRLNQAHNNAGSLPSENLQSGKKKDVKARIGTSDPIDKLKASNFQALRLRIGKWEYVSQREGDLVAKCYFAKHKLVWEVLDGGLKNKIEIQWEDIIRLKANLPANGHGTLTITLGKGPLFFRENNPQPRKHTVWQATSDFTNGEASKISIHYIECAEGVLNKHYEKLIHCDTRLNYLSQQFDTSLELPFSEASIKAPNTSQNTVSNRHEMTKVPSVDIMGMVLPPTLQCLLKDANLAHKDTNGNDYSNPQSMVSLQCLLKDANSAHEDTNGNDYSNPQSMVSLQCLLKDANSAHEDTNGNDYSNPQSMVSLQCLLKDSNSAHKDTNGNDYSNPQSMVLSSTSQCIVEDVKDGNDYFTPHCNQTGDDYWMKQGWEEENSGISRNDSFTDMARLLPAILSLSDVSEDGNILNF